MAVLLNYVAYYHWCTTRHSRAKYVEATLSIADMTSNETSVHKELRQSQIKSSEVNVKKVIEAFAGFTNPFLVASNELYCLSSGVRASSEIESSLLQAYNLGKTEMELFIKAIYHDPITRRKIKTFSSMEKCQKIRSSQNKVVEIRAERNVFAQLVLLSMKHDIDLELTLSFQLGPVPWALVTADGSTVKSDKSKLLHNLEGTIVQSDQPAIQGSVYICDGNAMTGIPETFEDVAEKIFGILPKTKCIDFVTDTYHPNSFKSFERHHRGSSPTFLLSGPKTRTPRDWKSFMLNDEDKTQLIKLLLLEWQKSRYAGKLRGRQLFFVCGELTSYDSVEVEILPQENLFSSQEEADTRMILHSDHIAHSGPETSVIIVRSPDTDVLVPAGKVFTKH